MYNNYPLNHQPNNTNVNHYYYNNGTSTPYYQDHNQYHQYGNDYHQNLERRTNISHPHMNDLNHQGYYSERVNYNPHHNQTMNYDPKQKINHIYSNAVNHNTPKVFPYNSQNFVQRYNQHPAPNHAFMIERPQQRQYIYNSTPNYNSQNHTMIANRKRKQPPFPDPYSSCNIPIKQSYHHQTPKGLLSTPITISSHNNTNLPSDGYYCVDDDGNYYFVPSKGSKVAYQIIPQSGNKNIVPEKVVENNHVINETVHNHNTTVPDNVVKQEESTTVNCNKEDIYGDPSVILTPESLSDSKRENTLNSSLDLTKESSFDDKDEFSNEDDSFDFSFGIDDCYHEFDDSYENMMNYVPMEEETFERVSLERSIELENEKFGAALRELADLK
uniref:WW domain-containing protein n=1 Tax=Parastrongyloides trichosuri TaxID=131310 RepID=A0A0N4Z680_PARTI